MKGNQNDEMDHWRSFPVHSLKLDGGKDLVKWDSDARRGRVEGGKKQKPKRQLIIIS